MLNTTDKIIKHKAGLLSLAEELGNVSKACQVMGMSRAHSIATGQRSRIAALRRCSSARTANPIWPTGSIGRSRMRAGPAYSRRKSSTIRAIIRWQAAS